jgi:hypothetical protein
MSNYIDAEKLIAEIERRIARLDKELIPAAEEDFVSSWASTAKNKRVALQSILSFIASLQQEQPEVVDLEKEAKRWWKEHLHLNPENKLWMDAHQSVVFARHFYELGLRTMRKRLENPEYNQEIIEKMKSEYPADELDSRKEE